MLIKMKRTMIQTIADLPTSVSGAVLCVWLNIECICRLDSAICMKSYRLTYHEILQSVECIGKLMINSNAQLTWANRRSIRSNRFAVFDEFSEDECKKFLRRSGHHIQTLYQYSSSNRNGVSNAVIAHYCQNLLHFHSMLIIVGGEYMCLLLVNPQLVELTLCGTVPDPIPDVALPNLVYLSLNGSAFEDSTCIGLLKAAPRLCYLSMSRSRATSGGLIEALPFCQQLRFFRPPDLNDIDFTLQTMMPNVKTIQHINLIDCKSLTDTGIIAVAQSVTALHSIHLTYSPHITNACLVSLAQHQYHTLEIFKVEERPFTFYLRNTNEEDGTTFDCNAVAAFREKCTKLQVFDWLRSVELYSVLDAPLQSHLASADRVTTLVIPVVHDEILHTIAVHCTQLKVLKIYDNSSTNMDACSESAIREVLDRCSHLTTIMVRKPCHRERFRKLAAAYPKVTVPEQVLYNSSHEFQSLYRNSKSAK